MQPFYTTLGTEGWRPDGCHMPLCAAGAGPFGNTASHRFFTKVHGFPAAAGGIGIYMMAPKAPYLASAAILYNSRGRKPGARPGGVSRSRTEPLAPRARGPAAPSTLTPVRACQPSGILESTAQISKFQRRTSWKRPYPLIKNEPWSWTAAKQPFWPCSLP